MITGRDEKWGGIEKWKKYLLKWREKYWDGEMKGIITGWGG